MSFRALLPNLNLVCSNNDFAIIRRFSQYKIAMNCLSSPFLRFCFEQILHEDEKKKKNHTHDICDHPHRILNIVGSEPGKTNALLNLIKRINKQILIKSIHMSKIHLNQSINYLLREEKK